MRGRKGSTKGEGWRGVRVKGSIEGVWRGVRMKGSIEGVWKGVRVKELIEEEVQREKICGGKKVEEGMVG